MAKLRAYGVAGRGVRLHRLDDPTTATWLRVGAISTTPRSKGQIHHMAGGKKLAVTFGAVDESIRVTFMLATFKSVETLRGWVDDVVVVRDSHGRVRVGLLRQVTNDTPARLRREIVMGSAALDTVTHPLEV